MNRAGNATGQYKRWWNIEDVETGHVSTTDLGSVNKIQKVNNDVQEVEEDVLVTVIPRYRHGERKGFNAKQEELKQWEEVVDEGQSTISTNWILTEKDNGCIKAWLTA